jgi:hypothetical protein
MFWDDWNLEPWPMNLIQGTIMGYKEKMGLYLGLDRGEDTPVIVDIEKRQCRISVLENQGYLNIYTYNGGNVWDMDHHVAISRWKRFRKDKLMQFRKQLETFLPGYGLQNLSYTVTSNPIHLLLVDGEREVIPR